MAKITKAKKAKSSNVYNADSLRSLDFPECCRHRIGMYFGSKEEAGVRRGWKEILDNSVDEHQNGHGKKISCYYSSKKRQFIIADQGRGVPSGWNKAEGKSGFELVFGTLHGSGKFDDSNYASSSGLNGIGASVSQAVASSFQAWSHNEGVWKTQTFKEGYATSKVLKGAPEERFAKVKQGTVIQWVPDKKIFGNAVIDTSLMLETCQSLAMLNPGLELVVVIDGTKTVYQSEHGLLDMIYGTAEQKQLTLGKPFHYQSKGLLDIAVSWQDDDVPTTKAYVNSSYTPEEGTHVQGARNAIVEALRSEMESSKKTASKSTVARGSKSRKKDDKDAPIDSKFLLMGMQLAMNWRMTDPVYSGQTKDKLTNAEVTAKVKAVVLPEFSKFLKQNPKLISTLLDRAKKFQKAADKFQQDINAVKSIKLAAPNTRGLLPQKLAQHRGKCKPEEVELFLVEGESAAGPCFTGSTKVQLLNGETKTFKQLVRDAEVGIKNYGYAYAREIHRQVEVELEKPRVTDTVTDLLEVLLSNGCVETCTPKHLWLLESGEYVEADKLRRGNALCPTTEAQSVVVVDSRHISVQPTPVYDLSVPDYENFALAAGCFVHNCKEIRLPFQEVLELRGKLLNAERATFPAMLDAPSVMGLIISMGAKPGEDCKTTGGSVRVGRVNIMTDADPDGDHICALLIALFAKYFPLWIEEGRIAHVHLPLFVGASGDQKEFGFTRDEMLEKFPVAKRKNVIVNRLKGLGECLVLRTRLLTDRGPVRFGSIIKNQPMGWSTLEKPVNVIDKDGIVRSATRVFRKRARVLRLRIGGRTVRVTKNHPFMAAVDGALVWKHAGDLKVGDVLVADRKHARFGKSPKFDISWRIKLREHNENTAGGGGAKIGAVPDRMTPELARLLGYLVADGTGCFQVSTGEYIKVAKEIKRCFEVSFPEEQAQIVRHSTSNMWLVKLTTHMYIREFLHSIGFRKGKDSYTKDVPAAIFSSTRECVAAFIQGVMESDGYFGAVGTSSKKMDMIEHYTASHKLANSMTLLFSMFGIHAPYKEEHNVYNPFTQKTSDRDGYQLQLFGAEIDKYMTEVGIVSDDKCGRILEYFKKNQGRFRNTNNDVLYGIKDALQTARVAHRIGGKCSKWYEVNGSRQSLNLGFSTGAADITYAELERNATCINDIEQLAPDVAATLRYCRKHNPRFVKVEEIKSTKSYVDVGDIEVPVSHSYIAEGLIAHNCTNTELFEFGMNPKTRHCKVFTMSDVDLLEVKKIMGKDEEHKEYRKEILGITAKGAR